jgi:putative phage-type endonuclease
MTAKLLCQASDPEWLELRRTGITASDVPVILGLVSWDSPWALYHRKRGLLPEVEQTDRMRLGSWLEDMIAGYWWDNYGMEASIDYGGLFASSDRPWQMATPDRTLLDRDTKLDAVLECKTSATRDGWGEPGTGDVPAHVRAQVLWQMDTLGVATGHVAVCFLPSGEFRSYTITHGPECQLDHPEKVVDCLHLEMKMLRTAGLEFYRRITGDLPAPPVDGLTVTTKALQQVYAGLDDTQTAELPPGLWDSWDDTKTIAKRATADADMFQNRIREAMGTAGTATVDGRPVLRRQVSKRAGYEVAPGVVDKLVRIRQEDDSE